MKISKGLIIVIFLMQCSFLLSQENSEINQNWNQLIEKLIFRTEITSEITNELKNSKNIDKTNFQKMISNAKELRTACNNISLEKENVNLINKRNNELSKYLIRIMVNIEQDVKLKNKDKILNLFDQLYILENQIHAQIVKYNESCTKHQKEELIFKIN